MKNQNTNFVVCIRAEDSSDIEVRKIYELLEDESAAKRGYVRVRDESGEDYLYPKSCFSPVELPKESIVALNAAVKLANKRIQPSRKKQPVKSKAHAARG